MIGAADDDQILEPSGDKQFVFVDKPQVAGPQERPLARIFQIGPKRLGALLDPVPITPGNAGSGNPDFADFVRFDSAERIGVGDHNRLVQQGTATADQLCRIFFIGRHVDHPICG